MAMYKIDRRGGEGGVQKSYTRTDPNLRRVYENVFNRCI